MFYPLNDFMVDLETLGTGNNAPIISIGVVPFNLSLRKIGEQTFYTQVNMADHVKLGAQMDAATVLWWMQQSDEARSAFTDNGQAPSVYDSLSELYDFMSRMHMEKKTRNVWGNASTFDNVILGNAYDAAMIERPWDFWGDRCYRTIKNLAPAVRMKRKGTHHNALDDAISQVEHLFEVMDAIEGKSK